MTNKEFSQKNKQFKNAVNRVKERAAADLKFNDSFLKKHPTQHLQTRRQASKFRNKKGLVYKNMIKQV